VSGGNTFKNGFYRVEGWVMAVGKNVESRGHILGFKEEIDKAAQQMQIVLLRGSTMMKVKTVRSSRDVGISVTILLFR
jgi:hypothetical protein